MSNKVLGIGDTLAAAATPTRVSRAVYAVLMAALVVQRLGPAAQGAAEEDAIRVYRVGKKVSDFPAKDDFSSPEAAYATISRHRAAGTGNWRDVSSARVNQRSQPGPRDKMSPPSEEFATILRNAEIVEVRVFRGTIAQVFARFTRVKTPITRPIEARWFVLDGGRWLNDFSDRLATVEEAAEGFREGASFRLAQRVVREAVRKRRPPVDDPQSVLKPYVEYLRTAGMSPKEFVLDAIARHKLVAIGEIHHRPAYSALNARIVRDPRFANAADTVYMELPSHAQHLVDKFLAADKLDTGPVIEMLRDNLWMGWPDQPMLDFFVAVWQTNQALGEDHRIRIVLVDMERPWKKWIQRKKMPGWIDRDKLMAENVLGDMKRSGDKRHALLIVGYAHMETLTYVGDGFPIKKAGWYLRQVLGRDIFSIIQHGPVLKNVGGVSGRRCLGLFDEAFAVMGNKPIAFALAESPFGDQRFDADGDVGALTSSLYREAFDGYVYLGPLEHERFSPLIPGFYTDEFVEQLDRRQRLMYGKGLLEAFAGIRACDARSFVAWMGRSWGQPRAWRYRLGPVTAWHYGDD